MLLKAERKINGGHEILWYVHMNQSKSLLENKEVGKTENESDALKRQKIML